MGRIFFNSPLLLGFDYMEKTLDKLSKASNSYPPYNIDQIGENKIIIKLAVAGFSEEELSVTQENNQLIVRSNKKEEIIEENQVSIHRGISFRRFEKIFVLSEEIEPYNSYLENGILVIELRKIIQEKNIKTISIINKNSKRPEISEDEDINNTNKKL